MIDELYIFVHPELVIAQAENGNLAAIRVSNILDQILRDHRVLIINWPDETHGATLHPKMPHRGNVKSVKVCGAYEEQCVANHFAELKINGYNADIYYPGCLKERRG